MFGIFIFRCLQLTLAMACISADVPADVQAELFRAATAAAQQRAEAAIAKILRAEAAKKRMRVEGNARRRDQRFVARKMSDSPVYLQQRELNVRRNQRKLDMLCIPELADEEEGGDGPVVRPSSRQVEVIPLASRRSMDVRRTGTQVAVIGDVVSWTAPSKVDYVAVVVKTIDLQLHQET